MNGRFCLIGFRASTSKNYNKLEAEFAVFKIMEGYLLAHFLKVFVLRFLV